MTSKIIELSDALVSRLKARKEYKALLETKEWTPIQLLFQEVQVFCEVEKVVNQKRYTTKEQVEMLKAKILKEFEDDEELRDALLDSMPATSTVYGWVRNENWKKAIRDQIRSSHVFSNENQLKVLEALLQAATSAPGSGGSVRAQELYFRLEGSLGSEKKSEERDQTYERYKNLQKTLHNKK